MGVWAIDPPSSSNHWHRLVKNYWEQTEIFEGQKVVITDESMAVSQLSGASARAAPSSKSTPMPLTPSKRCGLDPQLSCYMCNMLMLLTTLDLTLVICKFSDTSKTLDS